MTRKIKSEDAAPYIPSTEAMEDRVIADALAILDRRIATGFTISTPQFR